MEFIEKLLYLQKSYNLNDRSFSTRFKIKYSVLKKWKHESIEPDRKYLLFLCNELGIDVDDFMSSSSCLTKEQLKEGEHICAIHVKHKKDDQVIFEDFPREDNSRYEEKD